MPKTKLNLPPEVIEAFRKAGSTGGQATLKRHGHEHFAELGRASAAKRAKAREEQPPSGA